MNLEMLRIVKESYVRRHEPEAALRVGQAAWVTTVVVSVTLAVLAAGYGTALFLFPPTSSASVSAVPLVSSFNREDLVKITANLEKRATLFRDQVQ